MASIYFHEYYCQCGEYLFDNSEIVSSSTFLDRYYIIIKSRPNLSIYIRGCNIVVCSTCNTSLGGMIYKSYENNTHLVRFVGHKIERRKVKISIYRVDNSSQYYFQLFYGRPVIIHKYV